VQRHFIEEAKKYADDNFVALSLKSCAQYVGYLEAAEAFQHIHDLHMLDGSLESDVHDLRNRWKVQLKTWIELSCPHLKEDLQNLI
jgi:hypothetical protein